MIIGMDEVGLGASAGPIYVCAVLSLPGVLWPPGLRDSKKLSEATRLRVGRELYSNLSIIFAVAASPAWHIDQIGVKNAVSGAFCYARDLVIREAKSQGFNVRDVLTTVDGNQPVPNISRQKCVVGGDDKVPEISAASVLAKTARDGYMLRLHDDHPVYNWAQNKGYPTKDHLDALRDVGPCIQHRKSYAPVARAGEPR